MRDYKSMSEDELRWRGRDDARTLAEADAIKQDKSRMANAQKEAQNILAEKASELKGLSKVAGKPITNTGVTTKPRRDIKRNSFQPYGGFPNTPSI